MLNTFRDSLDFRRQTAVGNRAHLSGKGIPLVSVNCKQIDLLKERKLICTH